LQFTAYSIRANLDVGPGYAMSARDRDPSRPLSDLGGRLQRALNNHFEGLILFTIACVVITLSDQSTTFTATCAWVYLVARILYIPAYAFGLTPWRSLIWAVGFLATTFMLFAALI
jgi:uncharacterized MAPEG superfamily protein